MEAPRIGTIGISGNHQYSQEAHETPTLERQDTSKAKSVAATIERGHLPLGGTLHSSSTFPQSSSASPQTSSSSTNGVPHPRLFVRAKTESKLNPSGFSSFISNALSMSPNQTASNSVSVSSSVKMSRSASHSTISLAPVTPTTKEAENKQKQERLRKWIPLIDRLNNKISTAFYEYFQLDLNQDQVGNASVDIQNKTCIIIKSDKLMFKFDFDPFEDSPNKQVEETFAILHATNIVKKLTLSLIELETDISSDGLEEQILELEGSNNVFQKCIDALEENLIALRRARTELLDIDKILDELHSSEVPERSIKSFTNHLELFGSKTDDLEKNLDVLTMCLNNLKELSNSAFYATNIDSLSKCIETLTTSLNILKGSTNSDRKAQMIILNKILHESEEIWEEQKKFVPVFANALKNLKTELDKRQEKLRAHKENGYSIEIISQIPSYVFYQTFEAVRIFGGDDKAFTKAWSTAVRHMSLKATLDEFAVGVIMSILKTCPPDFTLAAITAWEKVGITLELVVEQQKESTTEDSKQTSTPESDRSRAKEDSRLHPTPDSKESVGDVSNPSCCTIL